MLFDGVKLWLNERLVSTDFVVKFGKEHGFLHRVIKEKSVCGRMEVNYEGAIAGKVLTLVENTRMEGLVQENRTLTTRNRELYHMMDESQERARMLQRHVDAQAMVIQKMRRENGSQGAPRRELYARVGVCAFCYEALAVETKIYCACKRFAYCSRLCKNTHWHRRHRVRCRFGNRGGQNLEPPYDGGY